MPYAVTVVDDGHTNTPIYSVKGLTAMKGLPVKAVLGVALVLAVLTFAPLYTHVLEWPGKDALTGPEWLAAQQHLYGGYALSGGITETLWLLVSALLAFLLYRVGQRQAALLAVLAA